ncbi:MAG: NADH-quinone oxidoreductase subunit A [Cytophagales bacterium]|nr:MAG: NADH-quinone oxidoreductase subunit A [Cytophagales bacterium]TAF60839.1 MAG: NADH-quinone oxidoreductase subunit A [Cytophagales bacterium]
MNSIPADYFPIFIQFGVAMAFVVATMTLTHLVGPKVLGNKKTQSFECGIESEGDARSPIAVKYFLVAILFVLFDVEIIFMYPWAVNFKSALASGEGIPYLVEMVLFMALLLVGFLYIIKKGVLKWEE